MFNGMLDNHGETMPKNILLVAHCSNTIWTFALVLLCCYSMTQRMEEPG